jgi:hypothetical protein
MSSAILVTGVAGSGKSTTCWELKRRGYSAYDIEETAGLFVFVDKSTGVPARDYGYDDPAWFERHDWMCDKEKLSKLVSANKGGTSFYCGVASNLDEMFPLFDWVFLLRVSEAILRQRLSRRSFRDFGRSPAIQDWLLSWKGEWEEGMKQKGAMPVDADRTIAEVVDEITNIVADQAKHR